MANFSHADNSVRQTPLSPPSSDGPLVLVVEDHEDTRFLLRVLLERRGVRVIEAGDGEAGVRAAEELHPDLILMDWSLPRVDGMAAMRLIRERDPSHHTPIVFLSGHVAPASQKAAREAGCAEYLIKPLDFDQLDRVLRKYLLLRLTSGSTARARNSGRGVS
jgi:two-component system cell cycle response regulator DivK